MTLETNGQHLPVVSEKSSSKIPYLEVVKLTGLSAAVCRATFNRPSHNKYPFAHPAYKDALMVKAGERPLTRKT